MIEDQSDILFDLLRPLIGSMQGLKEDVREDYLAMLNVRRALPLVVLVCLRVRDCQFVKYLPSAH